MVCKLVCYDMLDYFLRWFVEFSKRLGVTLDYFVYLTDEFGFVSSLHNHTIIQGL